MHGDRDGEAQGGFGKVQQLLNDVDSDDFQRFDPPPDLWARIESRLARDRETDDNESSERQVTHRPGSSETMVIEYKIDAEDVLTAVAQDWADFACANDAEDLASPGVGRTLWSYLQGDEIREVWRLLVERVRSSRAEVAVPFRCDAPSARRWFEMTLTPEPGGGVHFSSALLFEEDRAPVELLERGAERSDALEPVLLCSWCARAQHGDLWLNIEDIVQAGRILEGSAMPPLSHGICSSCQLDMSADLLVPLEEGN